MTTTKDVTGILRDFYDLSKIRVIENEVGGSVHLASQEVDSEGYFSAFGVSTKKSGTAAEIAADLVAGWNDHAVPFGCPRIEKIVPVQFSRCTVDFKF
jgi:hypothetical protein